MNESTLAKLSNETADAVTTISPSVVQVQGHRRPASGIVYANEIVLTTTRALGREDGRRVREVTEYARSGIDHPRCDGLKDCRQRSGAWQSEASVPWDGRTAGTTHRTPARPRCTGTRRGDRVGPSGKSCRCCRASCG